MHSMDIPYYTAPLTSKQHPLLLLWGRIPLFVSSPGNVLLQLDCRIAACVPISMYRHESLPFGCGLLSCCNCFPDNLGKSWLFAFTKHPPVFRVELYSTGPSETVTTDMLYKKWREMVALLGTICLATPESLPSHPLRITAVCPFSVPIVFPFYAF